MAEWAPSRAPGAVGARRGDSGWPRSGWFEKGTQPTPARPATTPTWPLPHASDRSGFLRLWKAFMSARLLLSSLALGAPRTFALSATMDF